MKKYKHVSIFKASGDVVPFHANKLKRSLLKSGASEEQAEKKFRKFSNTFIKASLQKKYTNKLINC
jgi:hypothetical protein